MNQAAEIPSEDVDKFVQYLLLDDRQHEAPGIFLACPFCGARPTLQSWHGGAPTKVMVACDGNDCQVSPMVSGETAAEARLNWNRRSPEPRRTAFLEAASLCERVAAGGAPDRAQVRLRLARIFRRWAAEATDPDAR
jgi:hypothetical protein